MPPPARAHDEHDPLLVAQAAAGDPLDPARAPEAQAWLRTCPHCAALAADLEHISAAVAHEQVPPRRRDFRLTAEQAEQLQGNAFTRLLRRLAAPRARALGPAAAGVLSLGLVFVVAGYALPEGGAVTVQTDANAPLAPIEAPAVVAPATALSLAPPARATEPPAPADESDPADAIGFFATDPEALEGLEEHQAGMSARSKAAADASEAELADDVTAAAEPDREASGPQAVAPADTMADVATEEAEAGVRPEGLMQDVDGPDLGASAVGDELRAAVEQADPAQVAGAGALEAVPVDDAVPEHWLIVIGVVLVLASGAVLLLVWVARRRRDPLLR